MAIIPAIGLLLPYAPQNLVVDAAIEEELVPVVSVDHPLARKDRTLHSDDLDAHVQLVLSDGLATVGENYGVLSSKVWRFVNLARPLDILLAGFGWSEMPKRCVQSHIVSGRLKELSLSDALPGA